VTTEAGTRPIVYLGPTLPVATAQTILDADYRPPIKRGDLPHGHDGAIIIIDGEFAQSLSVSPNEILRLVDGGTRVVGAASMGALRAAELYPCGMEGCGWIYEQYRSGRIEGDDEVAVTYAPEDMQALTVPLVNVRRWVEQLVAEDELESMTARRLLARARRVFYADRTERRLRAELEAVVGPEELARLLRASGGEITDAKADDARLVLAAAANGRAEGVGS
jgi:TfuA protein